MRRTRGQTNVLMWVYSVTNTAKGAREHIRCFDACLTRATVLQQQQHFDRAAHRVCRYSLAKHRNTPKLCTRNPIHQRNHYMVVVVYVVVIAALASSFARAEWCSSRKNMAFIPEVESIRPRSHDTTSALECVPAML